MPAWPYWIIQIVVLAVFGSLALNLSLPVVCGAAAVEFILVAMRSWNAGHWPWLAIAPPAITVVLWYTFNFWFAQFGTRGEDGLAAALLTLAGCGLSYVVAAVWAGILPPRTRAQ